MDNSRGLTLYNATTRDGRVFSVRVVNARIVGMDGRPHADDVRVDLQGDHLMPGLINAHDHLQLNGFPRLKYRNSYLNAGEWIGDIQPRLGKDPVLTVHQTVPRPNRLLLGGIKNLLSGVTTTAHHDPLYPSVLEERFPTRVVTDCGWSHSLLIDGDEVVQRTYRRTPADRPWIIHAAEGIDATAAAEFDRLETLGCLAPNTLIVHGVALDREQQRRLVAAGAGLIWCPSSNLYLFRRTIDVRELFSRRRVALGSDSRLTGARDLLTELGLAHELTGFDDNRLEALVTRHAALLLRLPDRGVLQPGALADLVVLPAGLPLRAARRADLRLVLLGGKPLYADPLYADALGVAEMGTSDETNIDADGLAPVQVDGRDKYLARRLVTQFAATGLCEPGLILNPRRTISPKEAPNSFTREESRAREKSPAELNPCTDHVYC